MKRTIAGLALVVFCLTTASLRPANSEACPFCSAVSLTFSEEMANSDIVVIARIVERAPPPTADAPLDAPAPVTGFEIVETLKGGEFLNGAPSISAVYFGQDPAETQFLLMGIGKSDTQWSTPIALSPRGVEYLGKLSALPAKGGERLAFFQEYFEDSDDLLARDAYDEFARASYAEVGELKDRMHREKLLAWIDDPKIMTSHKRLYLTMLSICGQPDDVARLETMITSNDREVKTALDALIACYLTLKGPDGLPLVEDLFLKNAQAEYTDTYSAIMALRFMGQEHQEIPKERLLVAMRYMLDRPELADLVIPDLARWEDWTVMNRLVELFKSADEKSSWVRVPVVNYLRVCPNPEAKGLIEELAKIDPDAVDRANSFFPLGVQGADIASGTVPPATPSGTEADPTDEAPAGPPAAPVANNPAANDPVAQALIDDALAEDESLPPAPVAESDTPQPPAAPATPAGETPAETPAAATESAAMVPAVPPAADKPTRPRATAARPSGWVVYVAPLAVAVVLFAAFQFLLRANRPVTPA